MDYKIEISYSEVENEQERQKKIIDILSEGVYAYLKKSGLLKEDSKQTEKIKKVLEKTQEIEDQVREQIEEEKFV